MSEQLFSCSLRGQSRKARPLAKILFLAFSLICIAAFSGCYGEGLEKTTPIRLGWQPPWANQGQIVVLLKRTSLLCSEGITVEFVPFTYGGPMSEAALSRRIDVVFAGEQPILTLLSRSHEWRIVARLTNYRSAIIIPINSPLKSLSELQGKAIATAFGSTTHRDLMRILAENKLDNRVNIINLDQAEHASVIKSTKNLKWGDLDGIATYDPTIASALALGKARILHSWASPALVAAHKDLVLNRRQDLEAFLRAYKRAYTLYAENPAQANAWYSEESRLPLSDKEYRAISQYEPNMQEKTLNNIDIRITDNLLKETSINAEVAMRVGIIKSKPDVYSLSVRNFVNSNDSGEQINTKGGCQ